MKSCKFSVVIPCFNEGKNLIESVESVVHQTYSADEIIVIDDGSTNDTVSLLRELQLPGVRVVSQTHIGGSAARNRGVWEAGNDFIAFLGPQYVFSPVFLEAMKDMILKFPHVRCLTSGFQSNCGGRYIDLQFATDDLEDIGILPLDYFHSFSDSNASPFKISSTMVHRSLIEELGGFPNSEQPMEDLSFFLEANRLSQIAYITNIHELEADSAEGIIARPAQNNPSPLGSHISIANDSNIHFAHYTNRDSTRRQMLRKVVR